MKKINLFLAFFLLFATASIAQDVATGRVILSDGAPLEGATVIVKKTKEGTKTDANGNYSLPAPKNSVLVISYVGYVPVEVTNSGEPISSTLKTISSDLGEVIVVGYGTQKKVDLTGAVTSIKADKLKDFPTTNLSTALAGRLSGVYVDQTNGVPGIPSSLIIRSASSWNDAPPLYVIDGVVLDKYYFDRLSANEISYITILKDAASSAIYGSRATGGVVLVTTKKGIIGKPIITLTDLLVSKSLPASLSS